MTTRQYLGRRWARTWLSILLVVLALGVLYAAAPRTTARNVVYGGFLVCVTAVMLWNLARTRCLHCDRSLGSGALWWNALGSYYSARCPHCHISIDRDVPDEDRNL
jgi:hypothetical protein